jgi:hypothetical protein
MRNGAVKSLKLLLSILGALALLSGAAAATAGASSIYYAAPDNATPPPVDTGNPCTISTSPCTLSTALTAAEATTSVNAPNELVLEHGTYSLTTTLNIPNGKPLNIHGDYNYPAPTLNNATDATHPVAPTNTMIVLDPNTTIGYLHINNVPTNKTAPVPSNALIFGGKVAEQIVATATGIGSGTCFMNVGTLRDSVCTATSAPAGTPGPSLFLNYSGSQPQGKALVVRNVTAYNQSNADTEAAIKVYNTATTTATSTFALSANLTNVIAHAAGSTAPDISVDVQDPTHASSTVTIANSNFTRTFKGASGATLNGATFDATTGNLNAQLSPPQFKDATNADFHEVATSPTVNKGADDTDATHVYDADRLPRKGGTPPTTTDMGAFEFQPPPSGNGGGGGGSSTTTTTTTTTTPPPTTTLPVTTTPTPVEVAPVVSAPSIPGSFAVKGSTHPKPGLKYGTTLKVTLSKDASLAGAVAMQLPGRSISGKCVKQTTKNKRKGKACVFWSPVGTYRAAGKKGANALQFSGKVAGHALKPGSYRMLLSATDTARKSSRVATLKFKVRK